MAHSQAPGKFVYSSRSLGTQVGRLASRPLLVPQAAELDLSRKQANLAAASANKCSWHDGVPYAVLGYMQIHSYPSRWESATPAHRHAACQVCVGVL